MDERYQLPLSKLIGRLAREGKFDDAAEAKYETAVLAALREENVTFEDDLTTAKEEALLDLQLELWPVARDFYASVISLGVQMEQGWSPRDIARSAIHLQRESTDEVWAFWISCESAKNRAQERRIEEEELD